MYGYVILSLRSEIIDVTKTVTVDGKAAYLVCLAIAGDVFVSDEPIIGRTVNSIGDAFRDLAELATAPNAGGWYKFVIVAALTAAVMGTLLAVWVLLRGIFEGK